MLLIKSELGFLTFFDPISREVDIFDTFYVNTADLFDRRLVTMPSQLLLFRLNALIDFLMLEIVCFLLKIKYEVYDIGSMGMCIKLVGRTGDDLGCCSGQQLNGRNEQLLGGDVSFFLEFIDERE